MILELYFYLNDFNEEDLKNIYISILLLFSFFLNGQNGFNLTKNKSSKIRFQLINNIIVIPVQINGVELSFILDTGVSQPILFNLVNMDSYQIRNTKISSLRGLGSDGYIETIRSKGNVLKIGEAISVNREVSLVFDPTINFTPRLGVPVHGIIGYDVFKDFVVEINYNLKYIRLHKHKSYRYKDSKKWKTIPIEIHKKKPYIDAEVILESKVMPVKLLIDSGGSDALWLFEDLEDGFITPKDKFFHDFLGKGLSGSVYGTRSKIKYFGLGSFKLENVNVAFPDSISLSTARNFKERNGSVSGNILKRFNIFLDYKNKKIQIKKNSNFKLPFFYNNSGVVLEQRGFRVVKVQNRKNSFDLYGNQNKDGVRGLDLTTVYNMSLKPAFQIVELRDNSNAKTSGLMLGDIIVAINNKKTVDMSLQEVTSFFYDVKGKPIKISVDRDGKIMSFNFKLDDVFKKKEPPKWRLFN